MTIYQGGGDEARICSALKIIRMGKPRMLSLAGSTLSHCRIRAARVWDGDSDGTVLDVV